MNFKKLLRDGYKNLLEFGSDFDNRLEYLSREIFDFCTYDSDLDKLFAQKAVEVCQAISGKTTFDYIKDENNYQWYIIMCNMPFFSKRLEWGTSIRGAWWIGKTEYQSCGLFDGEKQLYEPMKLSADDWNKFIQAIIEFSEEPPNIPLNQTAGEAAEKVELSKPAAG